MECWCSGYDALLFVFAGWVLAMMTILPVSYLIRTRHDR